MPEAATLEAFSAAADAEDNDNTSNENLLAFNLEGYDPEIKLNLEKIPSNVRMHLLRTAAKNYVQNRVSTAASLAKKANQPFDAYDAAQKNDPFQALLRKPEGARHVVDYEGIIDKAINALYTGEIGRRGRGEGTAKPAKDPYNEQLLRTLTTELFKARFEADPSYKYFSAKKEIGPDGTAYLEDMVARNVAAGMPEKDARAYIDENYVKPTRILVGLDKPAKTKGLEFARF